MATEPFQVAHESLHHATNVLPDNVSALGERQVRDQREQNTELTQVLRDFQAGKIGDHYANDVSDILAAPPTDRNLRLLAETETPFWQSDDGSTVGGLVSAKGRYGLLYDAREAWFASMPFEEEIRLRAVLGAPRD